MSEYFNERLDLLIEECAEVIQAASKVKRFGVGTDSQHVAALTEEISDVLAIVHVLLEDREVGPLIPVDDVLAWKEAWTGEILRTRPC